MAQHPSIYLDYAAATPLDGRVLNVMLPYLKGEFYNPSANYQAAKKIQEALAAARAGVAHWLGARANEVIFTAGGTEANNLAIHGVMRRFPASEVLVAAIEHESVLAPAGEYPHQELQVQPDGRVDLNDLRSKMSDQTVLVSVGYANNEIGTVQPLREVARLVEAVRRDRRAKGNELPMYLHVDACQATNYLDLHVARLGVDLLSLNGGKMYGPKQSGILYVKTGTELQPLLLGGGQERGLRSGTENVAASIGFAEALDIAQTMRQGESARLKTLQAECIKQLQAAFPNVGINGSLSHRLPNNIHLSFSGVDNERLLIQLDEARIMAAAGSACSASSDEPSHVLRALGLDDAVARSSLRLTMGRQTTREDMGRIIATLREILDDPV